MVAIVSGNSLGLGLTSSSVLGQRGTTGSASQGRSGEQAFINIANGNLVLQHQDEHVVGRGQDLNLVRAYNSQGLLNDDNADNWSVGAFGQRVAISGTPGTPGSTLNRTDRDGAQALYTWDSARSLYVGTAGAGAFDTIAYNPGTASTPAQFTWTDGASGLVERYQASGAGRLVSVTDTDANTIAYTYNTNGTVQSITTANGETTWYDYSGANLSQIRVVSQSGTTSTRVHYSYDSANRLSTVTVDLSPTDNSTADGKVYQTSYTYDGASTRVASLTQTDGSRLGFTYVQLDGSFKVQSVTDALGGVTRFAYSAGTTTVTDALGAASVYLYDTQGQLTQVRQGVTATNTAGLSQLSYAYDSAGNVSLATDGQGNQVRFEYDERGNLRKEVDAAGNTRTRTYTAQNQLLSDTVYAQAAGTTAQAALPETTRYVYAQDKPLQLRFVLSAQGEVTEYRYDAYGQRTSAIRYAGAAYDTGALALGAAPTEAQMLVWRQAQDLTRSQRTDTSYDARGALASNTTFAAMQADGAGSAATAATTRYIYDQAGQLLQRIEPNGAGAGAGLGAGAGTTSYVYDGLGRLLSVSSPALTGASTPGLTLNSYDDAGGKTTTTLANGLATVSAYDRAGRLVSVTQSTVGAGVLGTTAYAYDPGGNLRMAQDPTGVRRFMLYDATGRKVADVDGAGALTEYIYNANDQLRQSITYATRVDTARLVNATGQPSALALADIRPAATAQDQKAWRLYDSANRLVWQVDALGFVTQTTYDGASRIQAMTQLASAIDMKLLDSGAMLAVASSGAVTALSPPALLGGVTLSMDSASVPLGTAVTLQVSIEGSPAKGMVTFFSGETVLGSAVVASGKATLTTSSLPAGVNNIRAVFASGDANVAARVCAVVQKTVTPASTNAALTLSSYSVNQGQEVSLSVALSTGQPSGLLATGKVTFYNGSTVIGTAMAINGLATLSTSNLPAGNLALRAEYAGDAAYMAATSHATLTVNPNPTRCVLQISSVQASGTAALRLSATVKATSGSTSVPGGTVAFYNGATLIGNASVVNGVATLQFTGAATAAAFKAVYSGEANHAPSATMALDRNGQPSSTPLPSPTTTTLGVSTSSVTQGNPVTLTARIAGALPGGSVSFFSGTTFLGIAPAVNGQATLVANYLPLGASALSAAYAGDANNQASVVTQGPTVQVSAGAKTVTAPTVVANGLGFYANAPALAGVPTQVNMYSMFGGSGPAVFSVFDGQTLIASYANAADGQFFLPPLSAGAHDLTVICAWQAGAPTVACKQQLTVAPAISRLDLTSSLASAVAGAPLTLTAKLAPQDLSPFYGAKGLFGGPVPTSGTVTFYSGDQAIGTGVVNNGVATLTLNTLALGTTPITASYSGDANYAKAASTGALWQSVGASTQAVGSATTLRSSAALANRGAPLTLSASVITGANTASIFGGTVSFYNGTQLLGTSALVGGQASLTTTQLTVGTDALRAVYSGDAGTATSVGALSQSVAPATTTITLAASATSVTQGNALTLSARVAGVSPGGLVAFFSGKTYLGKAAVIDGLATLVANGLPPGAHVLSATYAGDANNATSAVANGPTVQVTAGSASVALPTVRANSVGLYLDPVPAVVGVPTAVALLRATSNLAVAASDPLGGIFSLFDGTTLIGSYAEIIPGSAGRLQLPALSAGTHSLTVVYSGSKEFAPASVTQQLVVNALTPQVKLSTSAAQAAAGAPLVLSAKVAPDLTSYSRNLSAAAFAAAGASGSVTFYSNGVVIGTASVINGLATLTTSNLAPGTNTITASYAGDANYKAATSGSVSQTIAPQAIATRLAFMASSVAVPFAAAIDLGVSATGTSQGSPTPNGGTVSFYEGPRLLETVDLINGSAVLGLGKLSAGIHVIRAVYSGSALHAGSTAAMCIVSVAAPAPAPAILSRQSAAQITASDPLSVRISGTSSTVPTGLVSFFNGATLLGSAPLANGIATLNGIALPAGNHAITAVYGGDALNAGAQLQFTQSVVDSGVHAATDSAQDRTANRLYNHDGRLQGSLDAEGYLTEYKYDAAGQLVETVRYANRIANFPASTATASERTAGMTAVAAALASARTSYSLAGLRPGASAQDIRSANFYDDRGQLTAQLDGEGHLTENTYDLRGNLIKSTRYADKASAASALLGSSAMAGADIQTLRPAASAQDQVVTQTWSDANLLASRTDSQGTVTQYSYDTVGNLVKTVQAAGTVEARSLLERHDAQGRLTAELTPQGAALLVAGQTQTQIDAIWNQYGIRHNYDAAGRRVSTTDQNGNKTLFFYDADSRLTHTVNALGEVTENQYDAFGQRSAQVQYANRIGLASLTGAKAGGLVNSALTSVLNTGLNTALNAVNGSAKDSKQSYTYNSTGTLASSTDASGFTRNYAYNAFREETSHTYQFGSGAVFGGASAPLLTQTTRYDRRGLALGAIADPGGINAQTQNQYDAFGRVILSRDANGNATTAGYDRLGRQVVQTDPLSHARSTAYDAFDRVVSQTDALGQTTRYAYTRTANEAVVGDTTSITTTTPEGITVTTRYNAFGQTVSVTDGRGNTTRYEYDQNGQQTAAQSPLTRTTAGYDRAGRLISTTDANGNTVQLDYDAAGRVLSRTVDPAGLNLVTRSTYSPKGERLSVTDARGAVTQFTYNLKGELTAQAVDPAGLNLVTQYSYDGRGKTLTVTDANGTVTAYTYDALGRRVLEVVDLSDGTHTGLNITKRYSYDANGNLTRVVVPQEHTQNYAYDHITRYAYDANNRLIFTLTDASDRNDTIHLPAGDNATRMDAGNLQENVYDAQGRLALTKTYANPISTAGLAEVPSEADIRSRIQSAPAKDAVQRNVYDRDGRLTTTVNAAGDVRSYRYDANGNQIQRTAYTNRVAVPAGGWTDGSVVPVPTSNPQDESVRTVYDGLNRARYTIDATGALVAQKYDANGNVSEHIAYATRLDLAAQPLGATPTEMDLLWREANIANAAKDLHTRNVYDAANRLTRSLNSAGQSSSFLYDANGNLLQQTQHATAVTSLGDTPANSANNSANDRFSRNQYDAANRLVRSADAAGLLSEYQYDKTGHLTRQTQYAAPLGATYLGQTAGNWLVALPAPTATPGADRVTRQVYDRAGRSAFSIDAEGAVTGTVRNALGLVTDTTRYGALLNAATLAQLDAQISATGAVSVGTLNSWLAPNAANDRTSHIRYDAAGRVHMLVDAEGFMQRRSYDGAGRLVQTVRFEQPLLPTTLNSFFGMAGAKDQVDGFTYDAAGNLIASTDAQGKQEATAYDGVGRKTSFTNKNSATWDYAYDAAGHLVRETSPEVPVVALNEVNGNLALNTQLSRPRRVVSLLVYDALGNLTKRTEAAGLAEQRETSYEYDALSRQVKVTYPSIKVYDAASDNLSASGAAPRVEVSATPSSQTFYDTLGNAVANRDVAGNWSYKTYDRAGRVKHEIDAMGYVTGYSRSAWGEVQTLVRYAQPLAAIPAASVAGVAPSASAVQTQVDAAGAASHAQDRQLRTAYDRNGRVLTVAQAPVFGYDSSTIVGAQFTSAKTTKNSYNAFGELKSVALLRNPNTNTWATTSYYFDRMGRQTHIQDAMGYLTTQEFDGAGNLVRRTEYADAASVAPAGSKPTAVVNPAKDRTTVYGYDLLNRKTSEERLNVQYTDPTGLANGAAAHASGCVTTRYDYDALGNLVATTDALSATTYTYYDALGRVFAVVSPTREIVQSAGSIARGAPVTEFWHDALGNTVATNEHANGSAWANKTDYARATESASDRVTWAKYDSLGHAVQTTDATGHSRYSSYDVRGQLRKSWEMVTAGAATQTLFKVNEYDKLGNKTAQVQPLDTTAGAGTSRTQMQYNAFGEMTQRSNSAVAGSEYFDYDNAGRIWRSNTGDGAHKIYLYDLLGNKTAELRSAGKTDEKSDALGIDLQATYGTAQAALQASNAQPEKFRRTDLVYDALGRVTQQVAAARTEALDQQVVVHRNTLSAAIVAGANKVQLQWPDMTNLGAGEIKIELTYASSQLTGQSEAYGSEYGNVAQPVHTVYASAEEAARGYIVNVPQGTYLQGITQINQVKVYKKDFYGEWKPVYSGARAQGQGEGQSGTVLSWTQPTTLDVGFPIDLVSNTVVELRPYGTAGDGGWVALDGKRQTAFGSAYRFDLSDYDAKPGNYEYHVITAARDAVKHMVGTGRFDSITGTATTRPGIQNLPPLLTPVAANVDIINGEIHQVLRWQTPPAGTIVSITRRPMGGATWIAAPWTIYTSGDGRCDAPAGTQEVAIDIDGAGTYEYELRFTYPASGNTPEYTGHAVGTYTVQPTLGAGLTQTTGDNNLPAIPGVQLGTVNIDGTMHNIIQWPRPAAPLVASFRYKLQGATTWQTRPADQIFTSGDGRIALAAGLQGTPLNFGAGAYEFELVFSNPVVFGPAPATPIAHAAGAFSAPVGAAVTDTTLLVYPPAGYTNQGVTGYLWQQSGPGRVPLYRWNHAGSQQHFYTCQDSSALSQTLIGWGWKPEGVAGYVETSPAAANTPLYRLNLPGTPRHIYTTDWNEVAQRGREGWVNEGIEGYVSKAPVSDPVNGTQAFYRLSHPGTGNTFYTSNAFERDWVLGVTSSGAAPTSPQGTAIFGNVTHGTARIDGSSYQVLQWPTPEAGARVRVLATNAWGSQWEVQVFCSADSHDTQLSQSNGQCVPLNMGAGAFTYQFIVEYPIAGAHGAYEARATKTVVVPGASLAPTLVDKTPAYVTRITGLQVGADIIDGTVHQVLLWPKPPAGATVSIRMRQAGASTWLQPAPGIYEAGDGRSSPPANLQEAAIDIYGPGNFEYELTFTQANGSKAQASGALTVHARQAATHADTTPAYTGDTGNKWTSSAGTRPVVQATHDRWGNVLETNDPRLSWEGGQWRTRYEYNASNQLIKQSLPQDTDEGNADTQFYYDMLGHQVGQRDALDNVNRQEYDAAGNVLKQRNADGGLTTTTYDAFGDKTRSTVKLSDAREVTTVFEYDKLSRLKNTELLRAITSWTYTLTDSVNYTDGNQSNPDDVGTTGDKSNAAVGVGVRSYFIESNQYDEAGRKIATTTGAPSERNTTRYSYDRQGNVVQSRRPASVATSATYDALNRKISETDGNGNTQTWRYDYFGHLSGHQDFSLNAAGQASALTFSYTYDQASQLVAQSNSIGQNLRYTYDGAGQLVLIEDKHLGQVSRYTYDLGGRRLSERMGQQTRLADGRQMQVNYQSNHMAYDSQGRLRVTTDGNAYVDIGYDKAGNRKYVVTRVINRVMNKDGVWEEKLVSVEDKSYAYDAMNRQTRGDGHGYVYDKAGNRVQDSIYAAAGVEAHTDTMTYDDLGRLDSVRRDGVAYETRRYDAAGRLVYAKSHQSQSGVEPWEATTDYRYNVYDDAGHLTQARVVGRYSAARTQGTLTAGQVDDIRYAGVAANGAQLGYDGAGNLRGYESTHYQDPYSATAAKKTVTTTAYQYGHNGGYLQTQADTQRQVSDASGRLGQLVTGPSDTGRTQSWFDANGYLSNTQQTDYKNYSRTFVNDAQGRAVYVNQGADTSVAAGRIQNPGSYVGGFIGTQANPGHVQRQMIVNGEVLARYGEAVNPNQPQEAGKRPGYIGVADFMLGAAPLALHGQGSDPISYTVAGGESLKDIAKLVLGDARLWYLIAEANGLAGDAELTIGQTLTIPQRPLSVNDANTFRPYDPSAATGSLDPALPALPQPGNKGCGGIGQIIMIVVAIIATIYTAGAFAASGALGAGAGASAAAAGGVAVGAGAGTLGATFAAGTAVLGGAAGAGAAIAAGAVGAAVGSIASQVVGNAIGAQDGFSWKQVALSALSGGAGAGVGAALGSAGSLTGSAVGDAMLRAAAGNAVSQGLGIATGLQQSFSWRQVASSAAGAGVGTAVGGALQASGAFSELGNFGGQFARGAVSGFAASTAAAVMRGGKLSIQQVGVDSFGQSLGQSFVDGMLNPGQQADKVALQGQGPWSERDYVNEFDRQDDMALASAPYMGGAQGLQSGGGYGFRPSQTVVGDWSNEITGGAALTLMRDTAIDAMAVQDSAKRSARQMAGSAANATSDGINLTDQVLGFAQSYPALAREINALEAAVSKGLLTSEQARSELMKSPRAQATLRQDYGVPDLAPAGSGPFATASNGRFVSLTQAVDPRAGSLERRVGQGVADGLMLMAGPEAMLGNLAIKGAVAAYGMTRAVGGEIALALRAGENSVDATLIGSRALVESETSALSRIAANNRAGSPAADLRRAYQQASGQIDFAHIEADVTINAAGKVKAQGGHFSASPMVEIISGTETLGTNGVIKAQVNLRGPDGNFHLKTNNNGFSTLTPTDWSFAQAKGEMSQAFLNKNQISNGQWFGESNGVIFQFNHSSKTSSWRGYPIQTTP